MSVPNLEGYICKFCNRVYKSKQSLWNHCSKYHIQKNLKIIQESSNYNPTLIQESSNNNPIITQLSINKHNCKYCSKAFKYNQGKWKHEQKCKINNETSLKVENEILKQQIKQQAEEINLIKQQSEEMQLLKQQLLEIMNKQCKIHPKTLQKINKQLNAETINENNGTINNNTINILALGHEDLGDVFSKKEKLTVLKNKFNCLPYLVEYTHFNDKYPQFKNIMITNMQNSIAYKYDYKLNQFVAIDKNELLDDLINERVADIEAFYDELEAELDDKTKSIIDKVLDKFENNPDYKEEKKKEIKLIIYNNKNKVSKDLEIII